MQSGFTVEGPWQTRSIMSVEVVSWILLEQQLVINLRHYCITCRNACASKTILVGLF